MKTIGGPRYSGKTKALAEICYDMRHRKDIVLAVSNQQMRNYVNDLCRQVGIGSPETITHHQLREGWAYGRTRFFAIDDADHFFAPMISDMQVKVGMEVAKSHPGYYKLFAAYYSGEYEKVVSSFFPVGMITAVSFATKADISVDLHLWRNRSWIDLHPDWYYDFA